MARIGYARVSTVDQNLRSQREWLRGKPTVKAVLR